MLTYAPGGTLAHRLDVRAKLAFQFAVAIAAFAHTDPRGLALLTPVSLAALAAAGVRPWTALWGYRMLFPFLLAGPALEALTWGDPWLRPADAVVPALASYRVVLVLLVAAAYVRTTPVRETRAAIQRTLPGKAGTLLGVGVGLVFRFFPLLRRDLASIRDGMWSRLGDERPVTERMRLVATAGLARAFGRADRLALALRARCFAWNPTLPGLSLERRDYPVFALAVVLLGWALV